MNLNELKSKIIQVDGRIKEVLKESGYLEFGEMDVDYDNNNPDESFLATELQRLLHYLDDVHSTISYLQQPIIHEGYLQLQDNGRYVCDGVELTCGSALEVLIEDYFDNHLEWVASRLEADHGQYYLVVKPNLKLDGIRARIRERKW